MRNDDRYSQNEEYESKEKLQQASAMLEEAIQRYTSLIAELSQKYSSMDEADSQPDKHTILYNDQYDLVKKIQSELGITAIRTSSHIKPLFYTDLSELIEILNNKYGVQVVKSNRSPYELTRLDLQKLVDAINEEFGNSATIESSTHDTPNKQPTPAPNKKSPEKTQPLSVPEEPKPQTEPNERKKRKRRTIPLDPELEPGIYRLATNKNIHVIDTAGRKLTTTAAIAAALLLGKHKEDYAPNVDCGDYVIIINCKQAVIPDKELEKTAYWHTGFNGGLKAVTYRELMKQNPQKLMYDVVRQLLPRNFIGRNSISRLRIYADASYTRNLHKPQDESF